MNTEDYIDNYNEAHIYPPNMVVVPYEEVKRMMVEYAKDYSIKFQSDLFEEKEKYKSALQKIESIQHGRSSEGSQLMMVYGIAKNNLK